MFGKKKEIPVYVFTGFLESGKTTFLRETMKEGQFQDGQKTVYIMCEEGIEELSSRELGDNGFAKHIFEEEKDITYDNFMKIDLAEKPDRVIIEVNGTWDVNTVIESFPEHWVMGEGIATVDAETYEGYLANMKQMMTRQFTYADLIVFNRCRDEQNLAAFKRTARAVNRRAQILFEMTDGRINDNIKEELPYDMKSDIIDVADDDYGIFYLDAFDHLESYNDRIVRFKGVVYKPKKGKSDVFVPGRFAMTCCAADIQFVGFPCKWEGTPGLKEKEAVMVTARVGHAMSREYGKEAPVLYAVSVEKTLPPKEEVVYFSS